MLGEQHPIFCARALYLTTGQDYFYGVHGVAKDPHLGLHWATKAADAGDRCGDVEGLEGLEGFVGRSVTKAIMRCNIMIVMVTIIIAIIIVMVCSYYNQ